jgi:hypothetical protein
LGLYLDEEQSPGVLRKMVLASVRASSYQEASREMRDSAELTVNPKTLERVVHRIGGERLAERDAQVAAWQNLSVHQQRHGCPEGKVPPSLAVVQFDCGRLLVRERTARAEGVAAAGGVAETVPEAAMQTAVALAEDEAARRAASAVEEFEKMSISNDTHGTPQAEETGRMLRAGEISGVAQAEGTSGPRGEESSGAPGAEQTSGTLRAGQLSGVARAEGTNGTPPTEETNGTLRAGAEGTSGTPPTEETSVTPTAETVPGDKNATPDACRSRFWRDDKVGVMLTMQSEVHKEDPCPQIPASFLDAQRMVKLVSELGHTGAPRGKEKAPEKSAAEAEEAAAKPERPGAPKPLVKSIVASRANSHVFGEILAAAAWARGFAAAGRKAFLADGAAMNWTMWKRSFSDYEPILDFIHALQYVFAAAMAGRSLEEGWPVYRRWIQAIWSGQVAEVMAELRERQSQLGLPGDDTPPTDSRQVVATTLGYLETHQTRMNYPQYRRLGLPIMTAYVESAVKQLNQRVKGTEKFWTEAGAEAILQLRADYLSETEPLEGFWERRKKHATGHRTYRRARRGQSNTCAV